MDIKDFIVKFSKNFRRNLFLSSQYCTYYNEGSNTILAGIMRDCGYKYKSIPEQKLKDISKEYRKLNTIVNSLMAVEIILYVYLVIFPYFIEFMKMPYYISILMLSFIPLVALFLTYTGINILFENYLKKDLGDFQKVKFKPTLEKIEEKDYQLYKNTARKSSFVLAAVILLFISYTLTPVVIDSMVSNKQYKSALKLSNGYTKLVPINPLVYAQKAYAEFKLGKYEDAVKDFENANKYSLSDSFKYDILGVKTYYLNKAEVLKEFDKFIAEETDKEYRYYLISQKAHYLVKNKEYNKAIPLYNMILAHYEKNLEARFDPYAAYYRRAIARNALGDIKGATADINIVKRECEKCKFDIDSTLVRQP